MTEGDLKKPKSHWGAVVTVAIAVAGAVWGGTEYLHSRASNEDTKALQTDVFKVRLDQETAKGDIKAINVRLDEGFKTMNTKLDELSNQKRRR